MASKKRSRRRERVTPSRPDGAGVATEPGGRAALLVCVALVLVTIAVYWPVLEHGFFDLDDPKYISENPMVRKGLSPEGFGWAFTTRRASNWHPLTWLSHMLDSELFGLRPGAHHGVSLLLHLASSLLLFLLLRAMTGRLWPSGLAAALFALHSINVESVAWLAERKNVLSTLFWMLTLWAYLLYVRRPAWPRYLTLVAVYALGLLAKPMLVTLPLVLLLLDYWPLGRIRDNQELPGATGGDGGGQAAASERDSAAWGQPLPRLVLEKAPLLLLAAASSVMTLKAQGGGGALASLELFTLGERFSNALLSYFRYVGKLLWPRHLAVYYPFPDAIPLWQTALAAAALLGLTALAVRLRRRHPHVVIGWLWYLGTLVPMIGLIQVGGQAMADRYAYVPAVGLFILLAFSVPRRSWGTGVAAAAAVVLLLLAARTRDQVGLWESSLALYRHSAEVTEGNYVVHKSLGALYLDQGDLVSARRHLEEALRALPGYAEARVNLGLVELRSGNREAAIREYRAALAADPGNAQAHDNLGNALAEGGRLDEAVDHFLQALEIDPQRATTLGNLANALAQSGRFEEALDRYEEAIRLDPEYGNAYANLGNLLAYLGRREEAVARLRRALELEPENLLAHFNLGRLLAERRDFSAAERHFRAATEIEPAMPEPRLFLGLALLYQGDRQGALQQQQLLSRLQPELAARLAEEIEAASP